MWKLVWMFAGVGICVAGLVVAASSMSEFTLDHPKAKGYKVVVTRYGAVPTKEVKEIPGKLEVTEETFDFGVMNPETIGKHVFVLRNVGDGVLRLKNMGTSCSKCTIAQMTKSTLQPGETSEVEVEFDCGPGPHYSQTATIGVENDIAKQSIQLRVEGRVRMHFGAEPEELVFEDLPPGKGATGTSFIYSQMFADAEIIEVKTSHPDFVAELTEIESSLQAEKNASWARQLTVQVPEKMPQGHFSEMIWITLRLPAKSEAEAGEIVRVDVTVKGRVKRGIQITGQEIDAGGTITLGILPQGIEKKIKLTLKIQNKLDRDLKLQHVECVPDFLDVKIEPKANIDPALGLYDIYLTVPSTAPACNYMREGALGQIRIVTENSYLGELPLAVLFAVREDG